MKRKKSNVKKIVIIGLILAILLLTILSPFIFINIKLIGDKRIELEQLTETYKDALGMLG